MYSIDNPMSVTDPEVASIIRSELERQTTSLVMIPSENYASRAVLQAAGSVMTNKYAEGYSGKRYYNGCEFYDKAESLAIERCKKIFGAEHCNVQLHTGASANMAVYFAMLQQGDRVMGMFTDHGGHLTHGLKINFSGRYYEFHSYGVSETDGRIDYDNVRDIALKSKPKIIVCGASAYPRIIDFAKFRAIADEVGAMLLSDVSHIAGLIVAGEHPDPVPHSDFVTSTTHKTLRGPRGAIAMCKEQFAKDLDRAVFPGTQAGPLMHLVTAKAVCFHEASLPEFKVYQKQVVLNAKVLAETLIAEGLRLYTGGTDNHLMLADVTDFGLTGRQAADILEEGGITLNRNLLPFDTRSPMQTSGIRPGTPALTTRGMKEDEMRVIGKWIADIVKNSADESMRKKIRGDVRDLCAKFPIYTGLMDNV